MFGRLEQDEVEDEDDNDDGVEGKFSLYWFDTAHIYHQI